MYTNHSSVYDPSIHQRSWLGVLRRGCVVDCPTDLDCSSCKPDEQCKLLSQTCHSCPQIQCIPPKNNNNDSSGSNSSHAGAIAGGVIGGVAVVLVVVLLWWFCIRRRKSDADPEAEKHASTDPSSQDRSAGINSDITPPDARGARTGSIASSILTRASNVIPIAYIPGFSNRSTTSDGHLSAAPSERYFTPQELRDSYCSDVSSADRASITPSLARSSVATTIYRGDAVPVQQAIAAKPSVVSVQRAAAANAGAAAGAGAVNAPVRRSPLAESMVASDDASASGPAPAAVAAGRPTLTTIGKGGQAQAQTQAQMSGSIVGRTMTPRSINIHATKSGVTKQPMTIPEAEEPGTQSEVSSINSINTNILDTPEIVVTAAPASARNSASSTAGNQRQEAPQPSQSPFADPESSSSSSSPPESRPATSNGGARGGSAANGPFSDEHEIRHS